MWSWIYEAISMCLRNKLKSTPVQIISARFQQSITKTRTPSSYKRIPLCVCTMVLKAGPERNKVLVTPGARWTCFPDYFAEEIIWEDHTRQTNYWARFIKDWNQSRDLLLPNAEIFRHDFRYNNYCQKILTVSWKPFQSSFHPGKSYWSLKNSSYGKIFKN